MRINEANVNVFESADFDDIDNGTIKNVKIVGVKSKNRRRYPISMLKRRVSRYESKPVNINHHKGAGDRDANDGFGWLSNVHVVESGSNPGLYGDLNFLTTHTFAPRLIEAAKRHPQMYGLSHDADAVMKGADVEDIEHVYCVDLVRDPGTTSSLFESEDKTKERLTEIDAGFAPVEIDGPDPMMSAIRMLLNAILDSGMESAEMKRKISVVLRMRDQLMEDSTEETMPDTTKTTESTENKTEEVTKTQEPETQTVIDQEAMTKITESVDALRQQVGELTTDKWYERMLREQNIDPALLSDDQVKTLRAQESYDKMCEEAEKLPADVHAVPSAATRMTESLLAPPTGSYEDLKKEMELV